MKRFPRLFLMMLLAAVFAPCLPAMADELPAPVTKLDLQDGDTLVFLGDSITHQCLYTQYVEDYFYTRYPKLRIKFHNAGVGEPKPSMHWPVLTGTSPLTNPNTSPYCSV